MQGEDVLDGATIGVIHIPNIRHVLEKFDAALTLAKSSSVLENTTLLKFVFESFESPTTDEIDMLTLHIRRELGKCTHTVPSRNAIKLKLESFLSQDKIWDGYNFVGEEDGKLFVWHKNKKMFISNFILHPKNAIIVQGAGGKKYHEFEVQVEGRTRVSKLLLTSDHFNTLPALQEQLKLQSPEMSLRINGCNNYMNDLGYKYIDLPQWGEEKQGTSLLGLEVLQDGNKYFCSPNTIYGLDGKESKDIVAMGNEEANQQEVQNWSNLSYDETEWRQISKIFLENILHINDFSEMVLLVGWMGAIPHDYVVRKVAKLSYFPHCQIVGEPGAGKSTIMTLIKQYMGHNDSAPRAFPSAFEIGKLLNSSYTIPVVLDEYGKRWDMKRVDNINAILVESFTRSYYSKGTANQSSIYYKHKNPLMFGGQVPAKDKALAERVVDIRLKKAFHRTVQGRKSHNHLEILKNQKDKNFWVGYNLWCARHSNDVVLKVLRLYMQESSKHIKDERVSSIYAIVMLGLHYLKKLSNELGVDMGITDSDILEIPSLLGNSNKIETLEDTNTLREMLRGLAQLGIQYGNNSSQYGQLFGDGKAVMRTTPKTDVTDPGTYGKNKAMACIYGNELLLIKVSDVINSLNQGINKNNMYDESEVMTFIQADFEMSLERCREGSIEERSDNLILAPKTYRNKYGNYTAVCWEKLISEFPEFTQILPLNKQKDHPNN